MYQTETQTRVSERPVKLRPIFAALSVHVKLLLLVTVIFTLALAGCAQLTFPQIDPTGQRILLPGSRTGVADWIQEKRQRHRDLLSGVVNNNRAFQTPAPPPACIDPNQPMKKQFGDCLKGRDRGDKGELLLTPLRIVAPVNGDVVLLAGICGEDGYLVTREPIEWMLSPDSVGTFLEVGDDAKEKFVASWHRKPKVEKLDVDFAKGRTSARETVITRGSPQTNDDLHLKKGQTWLSLTSPTVGISRVTVLAPDSEIWNRRRQTAEIYWIDATWQFPAPQNLRLGQTAQLQTQVLNGDSDRGAEGWEVIYTSLNPEVALFSPTNANVARATVDERGIATVNLINVSNRPGSALINVEVIRPEQTEGNFPRLPLGNGSTVVSWAAPLLQVSLNGPNRALPGQLLEYVAIVANAGDAPANGVALNVQTPTSMQISETNPPARQVTEQDFIWDIGTVPAQQQVAIRLLGTPNIEGNFSIAASLQSEGREASRDEVVTVVEKASLQTEVATADGRTEYELGEIAQFDVLVRNSGNVALSNVEVTVDAADGLEHILNRGNSLRQVVPVIYPGDTITLPARFRVLTTGIKPIRAATSIGGSTIAEDSLQISTIEPRPKVPAISISVQSQNNITQLQPGQTDTAIITITNTGETELTNIRVQANFGTGLNATQATEIGLNKVDQASLLQQRLIEWNFSSMAPGFVQPLAVALQSNGQADNLELAAQVIAAENVNDRANYRYQPAGSNRGSVLPNQANPISPDGSGSVLPNNPGAPNDSILPNSDSVTPRATASNPIYRLRITPSQTNLLANQVVNYILELEHIGTVPDEDLDITIGWSPATTYESFARTDQSVPDQPRFGNDQLQIQTIRQIRVGEKFSWRIALKPTLPGTSELRVFLESNGQAQVSQSSSVQVSAGQ